MFDVGDLPVLTYDNCVLKAAVIKWPVKLYIRFFTFFQNSKKRLFTFFELLHTFSRTLDVSVDMGANPGGDRGDMSPPLFGVVGTVLFSVPPLYVQNNP